MTFEASTGVLYFKLQQLLGFGELSMFSDEPATITYHWRFTANGKELWAEHTFSEIFDLHQDVDLDYEASLLSETWKNQYRGATKP